jgi:hypothetical protein
VDRESAARDAAVNYLAAMAAGDAAVLTPLMSTKAQSETLQLVRRWGVEAATAQDAVARVFAGPWMTVFGDVRVDTVQIEGDRAMVTFSHPTDYFPIWALPQ